MAAEAKNNLDYVDCYNCTGAKMFYECGVAMPGCTLCRTHGDRWGKLLSQFSKHLITITNTNGKTETFTPPSYSCLQCKDTKKSTYQIWDKNLAKLEPIEIDGNARLMPKVEISCHKCMKTQYDIEHAEATKEYFKCHS